MQEDPSAFNQSLNRLKEDSTTPVIGPPERSSNGKSTLWQDFQQGLDYLLFIWRMAKRIRGLRNQIRFLIGIILWKPMLPQKLQKSQMK